MKTLRMFIGPPLVTSFHEYVNFDDETILLDTALGKMTVKGEELHISSFNTENGELSAEGQIHAVVYMSDGKSSGGFLSKIFR